MSYVVGIHLETDRTLRLDAILGLGRQHPQFVGGEDGSEDYRDSRVRFHNCETIVVSSERTFLPSVVEAFDFGEFRKIDLSKNVYTIETEILKITLSCEAVTIEIEDKE